MSPTETTWKDWDQFESNIFKDTPATGEASEIVKATRSFFKDLQSIVDTTSVGSVTTIPTAARDLAEELKNALDEWQPKQGNQPKALDGQLGAAPAGTGAVTIDDGPWTKGGDGPGKGSQITPDQVKRTQKALAKGLPALAGGIRDAIKGFDKGDP